MLQCTNISHYYSNEKVLDNLTIDFKEKSLNALVGESGSGKSTLLSILSTLLRPTEGNVYFDKSDTRDIKNIDTFRNEQIGFVFQFHYLISHLSVYENVALATKKSSNEITALLKDLGIEKLQNKYPENISGGERQRVAIARALINEPKYIFADEPTGNLDSKNSKLVFDLLRNTDATLVVATHDMSLLHEKDTIFTLKDGALC